MESLRKLFLSLIAFLKADDYTLLLSPTLSDPAIPRLFGTA